MTALSTPFYPHTAMTTTTENTETTDKPRRPWYRQRRFYVPVIVLLLGYFCLVPSCPRVTPETAGGNNVPIGPDGLPDYFGLYEKTYIDKLSPPEDNGQRLMLAACGPSILEQNGIVENFSWAEISSKEKNTHQDIQYAKDWFETYWKPLCEHMNIDPYEEPEYLYSQDFFGYMAKLQKEERQKTEEADENPPESDGHEVHQQLWDQLVAAPWKAEDHPEVAAWLEYRSPVLDLFSVAVRKPNFACWRRRPEGSTVFAILLPDVQSNRAFARDLRIRITERLGRGDTDGALYDLMSMMYLGRKHYMGDPIWVTHLVGIAVVGQGYESAKTILKQGDPTAEQLERFAKELTTLPKRNVINLSIEPFCVYDVLRCMRLDPKLVHEVGFDVYTPLIFQMASVLPFDWNIATSHVTEFYREVDRQMGDDSWKVNPRKMKEYANLRESLIREKSFENNVLKSVLSLPLIRTRSRLLADQIIHLFNSAYEAAQIPTNRANTNFMLLEIAVALERYKMSEGNYPQELKELVPKYLEEIPLEPSTGKKTFVYKPEKQENAPFLLYAFGENGKDDGGVPFESVRDKMHNNMWLNHDVVF